MKAVLILYAMTLFAVCHVQGASVLDLFPETGVEATPGTATCSFAYSPSGSDWHPDVSEELVFLASVESSAGWRMGVGKGGHIYSLRGSYGESVAPQRPSSPWNDEVWQAVVTSEELIGPIQDYQNSFSPAERSNVWSATFPLMYFVHQSGIYTRGAGSDGGLVAAPFYSPCLRKRWDPETRTLELVNWMQQARAPCVWKSGVLIYTAYRDLGEGTLEVNQVIHNFGTELLGFQNVPWGGVRYSSLPHAIISNPDGPWEAAEGVYGWTDIPTRNLVDTGGWEAWTQDPKVETSPALALVFGTDRNDVSNGKRIDEAIRWGRAGVGKGAEERDYQVTERMSHAPISPGDSWSVRWYLISGEFAKVRGAAARLSEKAGVHRLTFQATARQPAWIADNKVITDGQGEPWIRFCAFPTAGTVPVFLLEDRRSGEQLITADPYALAETEPFPNPLPEDFEGREMYDNRVIYKQYAPHIGYENLLGFAYTAPPAEVDAEKILPPSGIRLHESARHLWVRTSQP